jgi:capsular polysaccharide biosynthesis protein
MSKEREELLAKRGVAVHRDVISVPLAATTSATENLGDHFEGGLVDGRTHSLIERARHYNGVAFSQHLSESSVDRIEHADAIEIDHPVLFGGILFDHFGHFMSESLGRLYAYDLVRDLDPYVLYYAPWGVPRYFERDNFVGQTLRGFGIPEDRVLVLDSIARLRTVVVPDQKYGFGFLHRPDADFVEFVRGFRAPDAVPAGYESAPRIYVSRTGLGIRASMIGERAFERYLEHEGWTVFHPEDFTLAEQLAVYRRAERLIFAEGSALLGCVLLPELAADVAVVCRRRDPIRSIRVATDCLQGYGKAILWIDAVQQQFQFGLDTWDALAAVDWKAVARVLLDHGFVDHEFEMCDESPTPPLEPLGEFLRSVAGEPRFVEFMAQLGECHEAWVGPSHVTDPRSGELVCPYGADAELRVGSNSVG